ARSRTTLLDDVPPVGAPVMTSIRPFNSSALTVISPAIDPLVNLNVNTSPVTLPTTAPEILLMPVRPHAGVACDAGSLLFQLELERACRAGALPRSGHVRSDECLLNPVGLRATEADEQPDDDGQDESG